MANWTFDLGSTVTSALTFDEPTNSAWFIDASGALRSFRILKQRQKTWGTGWSDSVAVIPAVNGHHLFVVLQSGEILSVLRDHANRSDAIAIANLNQTVLAAERTLSGEVFLLDSLGTVHKGTTSGTDFSPVAELPGARAMCINARRGTVEIATTDTEGVSLFHTLRVDDATAIGIPIPLAQGVSRLSGTTKFGDSLAIDDAGVSGVMRADGALVPFAVPIQDIGALTSWHSLILAVVGNTLHAFERKADTDTLMIATSLDPLARGGWTSIYVDYAHLGLSPEDVRWESKGNDGVSSVSVATPVNPNLSAYEHRVICGFGAPEFSIFAVNELDGSVIGSRTFRVVELWPDEDVGPPLVLTGATARPSPTWGGGPAGPQNIRTQPAPENLRVAVVFVKTKGSNAVVNVPSRIKVFADNMIQSGDSVNTFYEEVSYAKTPAGGAPKDPRGSSVSLFSNRVYGPLDVDKSWSELFDPADKTNDFSSWNPKGPTWNYLSNAFSAWLADNESTTAITRQVDSVIFAVLPGSDLPDKSNPMAVVPAQWSWAWGNSASFFSKTASTFSQATLPAVIMPASQSMGLTTPWTDHDLFTIKCHELGHNLGMGDQYRFAEFSAELNDRFLGTWDAMDNQYDGAHFSLAHRMRMGWINPDWIEAVDFSANQSSRTVTLQAIESLARTGPQIGAKAGIEIRIRDGRNYYFEYRRSQPGQIGDQNIPVAAAILGTDVDTVNSSELKRPMILLLPKDGDGDGPVLAGSGTDYEESDVTDIDRTHDFRIIREPINPANRNLQAVKIEYIGAHRAELRIRPAPGVNDFKSPDIDIDGPAGKNKVAKGLKNIIAIRVHNVGSRAAKSVKLHVSWIPFTTAPGTWTRFSDPAPQDIAAKSSVVFTLEWTPPTTMKIADKEVEHFCIRADIDRYIDPSDPAGNELNVSDNWAQSNFTTNAVGSASPSERKQTVLTATNILKVAAIHETQLEQTSEHFRSYLEHAWRRLAPGEMDVNGLWFESLAGDPVHDAEFQDAMHRFENKPILNNLSARTAIFPENMRNNSVNRWGAQLLIQAGRKSWIDKLTANPELVSGLVLGGSETAPVTVRGGNVRLVVWRLDKPKNQFLEDAIVDSDGRFQIRIPRDLMHSNRPMRIVYQVFFHGSGRFVPCESKRSSLKLQ